MLVQTPYSTPGTPYYNPDYEIARRWAPYHWQEVRPGVVTPDQWKGDLLTPIDFDGDWSTIGNWDAMAVRPLEAVVYFSVVEAAAYWFILYAYYHPRDWALSGAPFDQHENDMEGALVVVQKPGALAQQYPHGICLGLMTLAHDHFYSYSDYLESNEEDKDGWLFFEKSASDGLYHPCTWQEAEGHGCFGLRPTDTVEWQKHQNTRFVDRARKAFDFKYGKGIRYYHGETATEPNEFGSIGECDSTYVLVDIFEPGGMWERRCSPRNQPYAKNGKIAGRRFGEDKASPPWKWNDKDHASSLAEGIIATDPARLVGHYFSNLPSPLGPSTPYIKNRYTEPLPCEAGAAGPSAARARAPSIAATRGVASEQKEADLLLRAMLDPSRRADAARRATARAREDESFRQALTRQAETTLEGALAMTGSPAAGVRDPAAEVHSAIPAIYVLAALGEKDTRPTLVRLLESSTDRDVLLATCDGLAELAPGNVPGFKEAVVDLLSHGDWHVREAATRLYSRFLARRDPRPLMDLLADHQPSIRIAAVEGVGRGGSKAGLKRLRAIAADDAEDLEVRLAAQRVVGDGRRKRGPAIAGAAPAGVDALGPTADTPGSPEEWARIRMMQMAEGQ